MRVRKCSVTADERPNPTYATPELRFAGSAHAWNQGASVARSSRISSGTGNRPSLSASTSAGLELDVGQRLLDRTDSLW